MRTLAFDGTPNYTSVGYFSYLVADDHWTWSSGLYALHGYEPHQVEATTELMLRHKHPDDVARAFEVLENVIRDGAPFSCYHRIVDAHDKVRYVLSVGRGLLDAYAKVEQVTGFFVDLSEVRRSETQHEVDAALVQIARTRSVIDQAKGIIMARTGCSAVEAFSILRRSSSHQNVKVHELSRRLVDSVSSPSADQLDGRLTPGLKLAPSDAKEFDLDPLSGLLAAAARR